MANSEGKHRKGFQPLSLSIRPIIALACEGDTEKLHAHELAKGYHVRVRGKTFNGRRDKFLVDDALFWAAENQTNNPDAIVTPAALYDLETASNANQKIALEAVAYAEQKGVRLFLNAPTIERWFVLYLGHKSTTTGKRVVEQELTKLLSKLGLPPYKKPGNAYFHRQLAQYVEHALERCKQSGHLEDLPCMCQFVQLIRSFDPFSV